MYTQTEFRIHSVKKRSVIIQGFSLTNIIIIVYGSSGQISFCLFYNVSVVYPSAWLVSVVEWNIVKSCFWDYL